MVNTFANAGPTMSMELTSNIDQGTQKIIAALTDALSVLKTRVAKPYNFRFVSQQQATPFIVAYYRWTMSGEVGPRPEGSAAEFRAAIYDQAKPASQLAAFIRVASVSALELTEAALGGLKAGRVIVPYTVLRGLIERTAHATALRDALKGLPSTPPTPPPNAPLKPLIDLSEHIAKSLYGTQRNWPELVKADFRHVSPKKVTYAPKPDTIDMSARNILTAIDKLEKRVPGTRLVYEILCEFLHPNVGDLMGVTLLASTFTDAHGTRHVIRTIGVGPKNLEGLPEQQMIVTKMLDVCSDITRHLPQALSEIEEISIVATRMTRKFAHKMVKRYRRHFANRDPCPCLSGLMVRDCTRRI